jgi:hypothetical protein
MGIEKNGLWVRDLPEQMRRSHEKKRQIESLI